MSFCPNCGHSVDFMASFCRSCGTNLKTTTPQAIQVPMKEKGGVLEDSIAEYFRGKGFDVQLRQRMRDQSDVSHEIDVLASKREDYGAIQIAAECKYVRTPIDIKEVRNFNDKLRALGIIKGILVSTGGFTADAQAHASALGIDLWDDKKLQDKLMVSEAPQKDVVNDALPFNITTTGVLSPKHLGNSNLFSETFEIRYIPYYFADYHCFSQHTVAGNSVQIESRGTIVLDAVNGHVVDSKATAGQQPTLPNNGPYVECANMNPQSVTNASLPVQIPLSVITQKLTLVRAKDVAKIELAKSISLEYKYYTTRRAGFKLLKLKDQPVEESDKIILAESVYLHNCRSDRSAKT